MEIGLNINTFYAIAIVIFLGLMLIDIIRYKLKKLLRFILYENLLVAVLRNKFLQLVLPGVSGAYFLCLDVWGDKWKFISENQSKHELAFSILIGASLVVLIVRGIADHIEEKGKASHAKFIERFTLLTSKVVKNKLERFKEDALTLKPNGNTFKQLAKPKGCNFTRQYR